MTYVQFYFIATVVATDTSTVKTKVYTSTTETSFNAYNSSFGGKIETEHSKDTTKPANPTTDSGKIIENVLK